MVPVATMTPKTPRASKSVRISFMVVIPPHMKDSREMPFRKAGILPSSERTIMDGQQ
jgi:hypothetical protein